MRDRAVSKRSGQTQGRTVVFQPPDQSPAMGYLVVAGAAFLWALSGSSAKFLFQGGITPFQLVQLRTSLAASVLLVWLLAFKPALLRIAPRDLGGLFMVGLALAGSQLTYFYASSKIQVAAAILLQYQAPVCIALYAVGFDHEKLSPRIILAILGAITGCYLVAGAYNLELLGLSRWGIISGLASAVFYAWYALVSEGGMKKYSPWTVLCYGLVFAALIWNVLHPPLAAFRQGYDLTQWGWILFIGVLGTILPFGLYNEGVKRIRSTCASIAGTLEPFIAGLLAYIFLSEPLGMFQILGAGLVIASLILIQTRKEPLCQPRKL